jgi:zinc protease
MNMRPIARTVTTGLLLATVTATFAEPLPTDDRIKTGKLANGVTWMFRRHDNPPDKMALMVRVKTGSLNETEAQRGLAHFMEHLCFNGTENFPPGELIKYFESIGMEFGADLNAFTSFDQTVYMLFLPDTEEAGISKGLMTLSDYVFRALLVPEEIDKERGVVLAEWRTGQNAQQRVRDKEFKQVLAGSRFAERLPIGLPEVIEHAPYSEFEKYYRTWYRPELMTVMVVGDAPLERVLPSLEKWFGQYTPTMPAGQSRGAEFKQFTEERAFVITDPELGNCTVKLTAIAPGKPPVTTFERAREELVDSVGAWIVNRRLDERVQKGEASYQGAYAFASDFFHDAVIVQGSARGESKDWSKMLEELIVEIVRARTHGFTERELQLARKEILADAERAVETESTRSARSILFEMNGAVNDGVPISSAQQKLDIVKRQLPTLKLGEINAAFAKHFDNKAFAFSINMPEKTDIAIPSSDEVLAVAKSALARTPAPLSETDAPETLLAAAPKPGTLLDVQTDQDLQITSAWLGNGVRVHHRHMDYKKDTVLISITLAGGQIEEKKDSLGLTEVAAGALRQQPATSRLTSTQMRDLMTGVNVGVSAGAGEDTMGFRVSGSPKDIEKGLEMVHALITDGVIEESFVKNWKQRMEQQRAMLMRMPEFKAFEALSESLFGGDPRHRPILAEDRVKAITTADVQKWFDRLRTQAPIEVAVVGDLSKDAAMTLALKYLGSLPNRQRSADGLASLRAVNRGDGPFERVVKVDTMTPKAMAMAGFIGCQAKDLHDARALELASNILSSRLIETIREKMSLVYSLRAGNMPGEAYEDSGLFGTWAPCDPAKAQQVVDEVHKIYGAFAKDGPTEEELANAKLQVTNNLDEEMREPSYWLSVLRDLDYRGRSLEDEKAEAKAYEPYTVAQITKVFRKYYTPQRKFQVTALPAQNPQAESAKAKADEESS